MYLAYRIIHLKCGVYFTFKFAGPQTHCKIIQKMSSTGIQAASGAVKVLLSNCHVRKEGGGAMEHPAEYHPLVGMLLNVDHFLI